MPRSTQARIVPSMQNSPAPKANVAFPLSIRTTRLGLVAALVVAADTLFVDRTIGLSLSMFLGAMVLATLAGNRLRATLREALLANSALLAGLIPAIETAGPLSAFF